MTNFYMVLIMVGLVAVCGVLTYSLFKLKGEYKDAVEKWDKERHSLREKLDEQRRIINNTETGNDIVDFNNSVDILHQYAQKRS